MNNYPSLHNVDFMLTIELSLELTCLYFHNSEG